MTRDILDYQTEALIEVLQASRRASHDAGDAKRASEKAIRIAQECQKRLEQSEKVADHLHLDNAALTKRVRRLEARGPATLWIAQFTIPDDVRDVMRRLYPPIFPAVHLSTVTIAYNVEADLPLPTKPVEITVVGTVEKPVTQALAVSVGDHLRRPDGLPYFVTVSTKHGVSPKLAGVFEFNEVVILPAKLMFKFSATARLRMRRPARIETRPSEVEQMYAAMA